MNPFIDLPKPPTLPPNYTSLPSTLPQSTLNSAPAPSAPELPAYVVSSSGNFAAHPSTILAQNQALLKRLEEQAADGRKKVEELEAEIRGRELQERRRKAPGWLDRDEKILQPEKPKGKEEPPKNIMDEEDDPDQRGAVPKDKEGEDLGAAMDRAFGRSEMG